METKHSSIPWESHPDDSELITSNGYGVAKVIVYRKDDPAEANARFIVTACNSHAALLEACQNLLDLCGEMYRPIPGNNVLGLAMKSAKSAISLATPTEKDNHATKD